MVRLPEKLPRAWKKMLASIDARPYEIQFTGRSHAGHWRGAAELLIKFRLFGRDAEVDARLLDALRTLKLPGLETGLPQAEVEREDVRWSMEIGRLVAPQGSERESRISIRWQRQPPDPKKRVKCRKPAEQKASADVPTWLARVTSKRTTRRRIELSTRFDSAGDEIHMKLLYRNGFAHDENVGQIMKSLAKVGFEHVSGSGPRQLWKQPEGQRLELSPVPEDLNLGCDIKGPVLEIVLTKTSHGQ